MKWYEEVTCGAVCTATINSFLPKNQVYYKTILSGIFSKISIIKSDLGEGLEIHSPF